MADSAGKKLVETQAGGSTERAVWRRGELNGPGSGPFRPGEGVDRLAIEEPLEIRLAWTDADGMDAEQSISITMRTPGQDRELAIGFLLSEGLLSQPDQLHSARHDDAFCASGESQNTIRVRLRAGSLPDLERLRRHFYTSSSCGVCGKASLEAVRLTLRPEPLPTGQQLSAEQISLLPQRLLEAQGTFRDTGGLHAAGLFALQHPEPVLQVLREDVGRHNAVDKVMGWAFERTLLPLHQHVLMLSGRASFELVQKAIAAGIPILAAVGAPSSLAVDLALSNGMTLLGFVRDGRFNVYCGRERIIA